MFCHETFYLLEPPVITLSTESLIYLHDYQIIRLTVGSSLLNVAIAILLFYNNMLGL